MAPALRVAWGSYIGDGANVKAITGLGFEPKAVFTKRHDTLDTIGIVGKIAGSNVDGESGPGWGENSAFITGAIKSLDSDGFTLGSAASAGSGVGNQSGGSYYWFALGGDVVENGSYTGNAADNRWISTVSTETPDWLMVKGNVNNFAVHRTRVLGDANDSTSYFTTVVNGSNLLQQLLPGSFQVGTDAIVNQNAIKYHYLRVNQNGGIWTGSYIGDGVDNKGIIDVPFTPEIVIIKRDTAVSSTYRLNNFPTGSSTTFRNGANVNYSGSGIKSYTGSGFILGNDTTVNALGGVYQYIALRNFSGSAVQKYTRSDTSIDYGSNDSSLYIYTGSFVGDGADNRWITGVVDIRTGSIFTPSVVIVGSSGPSSTPWIKLGQATTDISKSLVGGTNSFNNRIQQFASGSFQLGTDVAVNRNLGSFFYVALGGNDIKTGDYSGNGAIQQIGGIGSPSMVYLFGSTPTASTFTVFNRWKTFGPGQNVTGVTSGAATTANAIISLDNNGFTVGSAAQINTLGSTFVYAAFVNLGNAPWIVGSYTGDGATNRQIPLPFRPYSVMVSNYSQGSNTIWKIPQMPSGSALSLSNGTSGGMLNTSIKSLDDYGFTIGSLGAVNNPDSIIHYIAFGGGSSSVATITSDTTISDGTMQVYVGSYTGNGADNRWLTDINNNGSLFTPTAAFLLGVGAGVISGRLKIGSPITDSSRAWSGANQPAANSIQRFALGSLQIGTNAGANQNGSVYHFLAIGGFGDVVDVGNYLGNNTDNRHIPVSFGAPKVVIVSVNSPTTTNQLAVFKTVMTAGSDTTHVFGTNANIGNAVQQLSGSGFEIGTDTSVNAIGSGYTYIAFANNPKMSYGSYVGDGVDDRHISTSGSQTQFALIKRSGVATSSPILRYSTEVGDLSLGLSDSPTVETANWIQQFSGSGFEVGTAAQVNQTGSIYNWFAFGSEAPVVGSTVGSMIILSDTSISATYTSTKPSDTVITGSEVRPIFSNSVITGSEQRTILSNTTITGSEQRIILSDTVLTGSEQRTILSNTIITGSETRTIFSNTVLTGSEQRTILSDSVLTGSEQRTILSNTVLSGSEIRTILSDTVIMASISGTKPSDTVITGSEIRTILSNSFLTGSEVRTILTDTFITGSIQRTITSDSFIIATLTQTIISNTYIHTGEVPSRPVLHNQPYNLPGQAFVQNIPRIQETQYNLPGMATVQDTPRITNITSEKPGTMFFG